MLECLAAAMMWRHGPKQCQSFWFGRLEDNLNSVALTKLFDMRCKLIILTSMALLSFQKGRAQQYVKDIFHDKIPLSYAGKLIDAYEYKDKNGLHIYMVTKSEEEKPENKVTIVGSAYTLVNGNYVKDWSITDFSGLDVLFKYTYTKIV